MDTTNPHPDSEGPQEPREETTQDTREIPGAGAAPTGPAPYPAYHQYPAPQYPTGYPAPGQPAPQHAPQHAQPGQQPGQQQPRQPGQPYAQQPYAQQPWPTHPYAAYPPYGSHRGRRPWRAALVGGLVGGVAAAAIGIPLTWAIADHAAAPVAGQSPSANGGTQPNEGSNGGSEGLVPQMPGGGSRQWTVPGANTQATGTAATDQQSKGVLLVNTELPNGAGAGTGMVLSSSGLALTNYHVVEGSTSVTATVASTGKTYDADVVGYDAKSDVALIRLQDASGLDTVHIDNDGATLQQQVTAVGNAMGQGELLAASGTITAEDQSITTRESGSAAAEHLSGLLETDAPVVSGYSGGPMYDAQGEVVGISTAASSGMSSTGAVESYAVPIHDALSIVDQIEAGNESGDVTIGPAPFLGIVAGQSSGGVGVAEVEQGGPAAKAGVTAGDTVTAVDGTKVGSLAALRDVLAQHEPGDSVAITWRDASGAQHSGTVHLAESPVN
ncbi:PDZ domain-containing protein [Nocardioides guangzhouensis]|uniref:PDZ domain-containing protein n=1 Tax=Nocardioides guangzhouensis TaxID=2497878 RepID=A0A4Q4ZN00_9ACTN|nr:trypsin-like peptidase domain-containing protein [Nocardioides guangzhouensis]RYP88991.1 PDZ domain-containing protein [Nocardioides guangzhouensis]